MKLFLACLLTAVLPSVAIAQTDKPVTLTTYNLHSGIPRGHSNASYFATMEDMHNITDVLTSAGADIVALQEVRNQWPYPAGKDGTPPDMARELGRLLDMNYAFASTLDQGDGLRENRDYRHWGRGDNQTSAGAHPGKYGNGFLSRFQMEPPSTIKLPLGEQKPGTAPDEPRNALRAVLPDVPGLGRVIVYATHFQHNNGQTRERQMKHLLEVAGQDATSATVFLMGDFNHSPHKGEPDLLGMVKSAGFHDLAAEFALANNTEPEPTMPESTKSIRIDYIFCSKPLNVTQVNVLKTDVSDHYPLTVTVQP